MTCKHDRPIPYSSLRAARKLAAGIALIVGLGVFAAPSSAQQWTAAGWAGGLFGPLGTDGIVHTGVCYDDGSGTGPALFIGGDFQNAGGDSNIGVAKWWDNSWSPALAGGPPGGNVRALLPFGGILVAGGYQGLYEWDGVSWSVFTGLTGGVGVPHGGSMTALVSSVEGGADVLYVGAESLFTNEGGTVNYAYIARWDGTSWSTMAGGLNGPVASLAVHDDGTGPALYASGNFTIAGGVPVNRIARWKAGVWSSVGPGFAYCCVHADVLYSAPAPDGGLYAGSMTTLDGFHWLLRWNGSAWQYITTLGGVGALTMIAGDLYVGGEFSSIEGVPAKGIAKRDAMTGLWSAVGDGINGGATIQRQVRAMVTCDTGEGEELFVCGEIRQAGPWKASNIAKWNGIEWSELGCPGPEGTKAMLGVEDLGATGSIIAGGLFESVYWRPTYHNVAKWDKSTKLWRPMGHGLKEIANQGVNALASYEGMIWAGGSFSVYPNNLQNNAAVAVWDPGADDWVAADAGLPRFGNSPSNVRALKFVEEGPDAGLFAAGDFGVAKWNSVSLNWSVLPRPGGMNNINAMTTVGTDADTHLVVAGHRVALLTTDGWRLLPPFDFFDVFSLAGFTDSLGICTLYAGGNFSSTPPGNAFRFAGWHGGPSWYSPVNMSGQVSAMQPALVPGLGPRMFIAHYAASGVMAFDGLSVSELGGIFDLSNMTCMTMMGGQLYVGGTCNSAGGAASSNIAEYLLPETTSTDIPCAGSVPIPVRGDMNWDGVLDAGDVALFAQALLGNGDVVLADINGDGVVNGLDIAVFVRRVMNP